MKTWIYKDDLIPNEKECFDKLYKELNWYHAEKTVPRKEYYIHNDGYDYTYGTGKWARTYNSMLTHEIIEEIRKKLNDWLNVEFDVVFLNLYEDKKNHLGWHADDSPEMSNDHPIVTVSLGSEREIWFRKNETKEIEKLNLKSGSACAMLAGMQKTHEHRIPKCHYDCGPRISLTYRKYVKSVI